MKKILFAALLSLSFIACNNGETGDKPATGDTTNTSSETDLARDLQQLADSGDKIIDTIKQMKDTILPLIPMKKMK